MGHEWTDELRRALGREASGSNSAPAVGTLATVDRSGAPRARSVILRRIDDESQLYVVSDARADKNAHVRGDGRAEIVFWLPGQQTQFRVFGEMRVIALGQDEPLRRELWRELNDQARSIFFWPTPGIAVAQDEAYPRAVSADVAPPKTFEVLVLRPQQVERLTLSSFPHRRRRWRADSNWSGVDVNP
jgi:PPOX class probable FMN-dependent enzyme